MSRIAALGERLAARIARPAFRPYLSDDVVGAEIGGAVKNVLAIACGVVEGRGLGHNARAALIARGFAEMTRFGARARARAPRRWPALPASAIWCSPARRPARAISSLGKGSARGARAADLLADRKTVAEGASPRRCCKRAAAALGVDMPIVDAVCALLAGEASVDEAVARLLARPLRAEGV